MWRCSTFLFILFVIDNASSILTQSDRGLGSTAAIILPSPKKLDDRFSVDLNEEQRNTSTEFDDKETKGDERGRYTGLRDSTKEKKPRTFLGPLSLDFKDKLNPKRGIIYDTRDSFGGGLVSG